MLSTSEYIFGGGNGKEHSEVKGINVSQCM
jgi:hypothetical protein